MDLGTERAIKELAFGIGPKFLKATEALTKELKRANDREEAERKEIAKRQKVTRLDDQDTDPK
jgi:hypothetical protein